MANGDDEIPMMVQERTLSIKEQNLASQAYLDARRAKPGLSFRLAAVASSCARATVVSAVLQINFTYGCSYERSLGLAQAPSI